MRDWQKTHKDLTSQTKTDEGDLYRLANVEMIKATLAGAGPHSHTVKVELGMKAVVNIAARHALPFLDTTSGKPGRGTYINRPAVNRIVGTPPNGPTVRDRVDEVLEQAAADEGHPTQAADMHFAALELNGTGIAYFGDVCLVLKDDAVPDDTLILIHNSYDMTVPPVVGEVYEPGDWRATKARAVKVARSWAGTWEQHAVEMAVVKVLFHRPDQERRLTTGQISDSVLTDEDYIEVVRGHSFSPAEVQEIRFSAADAAREAQIADHLMLGPHPTASEMLWRARRRAVWRMAQQEKLPCRVVTSTGRSRR